MCPGYYHSSGLLKTVAKALEKQRLIAENQQLRRQLRHRRSLEALIGNSAGMQAVKTLIHQIALHERGRAHPGRKRYPERKSSPTPSTA